MPTAAMLTDRERAGVGRRGEHERRRGSRSRLAPLGVETRLTAALPDEIEQIAEFVRAEAPRVDFLLVTGGLGGTPTT